MATDAPGPCPLCQAAPAQFFHQDAQRTYFQCPVCRLVFVPPQHFLAPDRERACYDLHQNDPNDPRYRRFLSRLFEPLKARLQPGDRGLDFGSGPGPTLSVMFEEAGHSMAIYDPFYAPHQQALQQQWDFITASEVFEHLHHPARELERLWSLLKPGGWLGVMTKRVADAAAFAAWHYKNDPTHVIFFAAETFHWLANRWNAQTAWPAPDVVLLQKPAHTAPHNTAAPTR